MLSVATWNTGVGFRRATNDAAWEYLLGEVDADAYLVQEADPPDWVAESHDVRGGPIDATRPWGSYVVAPEASEVDLSTPYAGALTAATATLRGTPVTLVSVYGLLEPVGSTKYSITTLHRMFSDLTGVLNGHRDVPGRFVLGGDFNASPQFDERYDGEAHRILFDRIADFGLTDCVDAVHGGPVRTYRHNRGSRAWQLDHLFASESLRVVDCEVIETDRVRELSDHNPVVVRVEV
jgi:endonuclease/exonuclease/phosphatase (EEP) superfamily protein YafD